LPRHTWDTVQMPVNVCDWHYRSFIRQVIPEAVKREIAVIGMKSLGGEGTAVKRRAVTAEEALRYAMSLPVATTVSGIDSLRVLRQNLRVARGFAPFTQLEMQQLRARVAPLALDGKFELYKTTAKHEGPIGRKQHGFPAPDEQES